MSGLGFGIEGGGDGGVGGRGAWEEEGGYRDVDARGWGE